MAWTICEGYGMPIGSSSHGFPKEGSPVSFTLHLSSLTRKQFCRRLQEAYGSGSLKLIKRLHALLALAQGQSVREVAHMLALGEQTVRDYRNQFLFKGMASLVYQSPKGRPSKLSKTQRQQLAEWIKASPQDSGYTSGCWNTPMIQDLIWRQFQVAYHPHYLCTLLKNMGFSYQKARFVSDHLNEAKRLGWRQSRWPKILRHARQKKALLLFGDEASFAQWGSLSYKVGPPTQPGQPKANSLRSRPAANARRIRSLVSSTISLDDFSTRPMSGVSTPRVIGNFCLLSCLKRHRIWS
jgi:transposase